MNNLIERLEKATGPDREIDTAIFTEVVQPFAVAFKQYRGMAWISHDKGTTVPSYTASIDAALTLVPDGWRWKIYDTGVAFVGQPHTPIDKWSDGQNSRPAIALCIAALKARAVANATV